VESSQKSSLGLPAEGKKRWCAGCATGHAGAVNVGSNKCEDCRLKQPNFGLPSDGKKRWCGGCARAHAGAVHVGAKKCEGCDLKQPSFGLPSEGKARWCAGCAKAHAGAVDIKYKKCEDCELKKPSFGLPSEGKKRWCAGCAKAHAGAISLASDKKCEGCGENGACFGQPSEGLRWCASCAKGHPGAVYTYPRSQMCERCQLKLASFGLPSGGKKRRWCGDCAPKEARSARGTRTLAKDGQYARWEAQLAKLAQYKCEHGDCNVPPVYDLQLSRWVSHQRVRKKKLDRGEPSLGMTTARAAKLEALGFEWELSAAAVIRQMRRAGTADFNPRRRLPREPKATAPPLTALTNACRPPNLCSGSRYCLVMGHPYRAALQARLRV
jgi:hypothetical protein